MLAYPIAEAEELLKSKLDTAKKSLETCEEDMEFLREQITVRTHAQPAWSIRSDLWTIDIGGCLRPCVQLGRGAA